MRKIFFMVICALAAVTSLVATSRPDYKLDLSQEKETELSKEDIIKICKWYVATSGTENDAATKELRQGAAALLIKYAIDTPDIKLGMGEAQMQLLNLGTGNDDSSELLMVYMSGEIAYCLENNLKENDAQSFVYAMSGVIDAYSKMKNHDSEQLNKYLNLGEEQRTEELLDYYNEMTKAK